MSRDINCIVDMYSSNSGKMYLLVFSFLSDMKTYNNMYFLLAGAQQLTWLIKNLY